MKPPSTLVTGFQWKTGVLAALIALGAQPLQSANPRQIATRERLAARVTLTWQGGPASGAIARIERAASTPIWIDRRLDRSKQVSLALTNAPLQEGLDEIARVLEATPVVVGDVVYLAPKNRVRELLSALDQSNLRGTRRPLREVPFVWPRLTEPKTAVNAIARSGEIEVRGLELVEHDLWPAWEGGEIDAELALRLVLFGFELTTKPTGPRELTIVPLPLRAADQADTSQDVAGDRTARPGRGPIPRAEPLPKAERSPIADKRVSLRVSNQPSGAVLRSVTNGLGLKFRASQEAQRLLVNPISLTIEGATVERFLHVVQEKSGVVIRLEGDSVLALTPDEAAAEPGPRDD